MPQPPPSNLSPQFQIAVRHFQAGEYAQAQHVCEAILQAQPNEVEATHMLALLHSQAGRHELAIQCFERAIALRPLDAILHNNLGEALRKVERHAQARVCFLQSIRLAPRFPEAYFNLSHVFKHENRYEDAKAALNKAIELRPSYAKAYFNLANLLREEGRVKTALTVYEQALALQPHWADVHLNLANAHSELGNLDQAIEHYQRAMALDPKQTDLDISLGHAYLAQGQFHEAQACYRRDLARRPNQFLAQLRLDALCPPVVESEAEIDAYQARLGQVLERALEAQWTLDLTKLHSSGAEPPMALAYQGRDVLPWLSRYAALFAPKIRPLELAPRQGKPKVGIVVTHGHEGVFARCWGSLAERLPRKQLKVRIVCSRSGANVLQTMLRIDQGEYFILSEQLDQAAEQLNAACFDVLHYWEIGTDSTNYFLPYLRPAPVQLATWGWPVTTGHDRVQGYVSQRSLEPLGAERHYQEPLIRLTHLPTCYARPQLPQRLRGREHWGLSASAHLYFCTQNVRKYHPQFDLLLAELLQRDPLGKLLIIADAQPRITERLLTRLRRSIPDVAQRVQVLPRMEREDYLNVLSLADVVLDTFPYGGGANTVLDCMAVGAPLVTWPGSFQRGRWGLAVYEALGITDCIATSAAHYVELAHRVATEPAWHRDLSTRILARCPELFDNQNTVGEHVALWLSLIDRSS